MTSSEFLHHKHIDTANRQKEYGWGPKWEEELFLISLLLSLHSLDKESFSEVKLH